LFRTHRVFTFSSIAALINYSATFALTFLMSLYLQYVKGLNPQTAGLILVAQPVMMALFSPVAGRLSDRFEPRILSSAGMSLTALGLLQLVFLNEETSIPYIVGILIMLGLGFAMFSSPNMNAIMSSVEKRYYGIASGAVATMRLLGQMLSMAIATVTFAVLLGNAQIGAENLPLFLKSVKIVFLILTVLCTVGIFFSISRGELRQGDEAAS
jgi:MFS family permease